MERREIERLTRESEERNKKLHAATLFFIPVCVITSILLIIAFGPLKLAIYWKAIAAAFGVLGAIYTFRLFFTNMKNAFFHYRNARKWEKQLKNKNKPPQ